MIFIRNTSQVLTITRDIIPRGAMLIDGENIIAVGSERSLAKRAKRAREIDACGCVVMPGFVDSHTHPVFATSRIEEFEMRIRGVKYDGSGIQDSARKVRAASEAELLAGLKKRITQFHRHGTTTIEAKSGYGLTRESELKMLRVIRQAGLIPTFLAHAKGGCELVTEIAEFGDVFCDRVAFSVSESRRILTAAQQAGMKLKIHADQTSRTGGAQLAAELGAVSADHLECANEADARALKKAGVVATLLPGVAFHLGTKYPPARMLLDAGVTVALATDFNPGTCPCLNMQLIIAIACSQMRMTPAEAIRSATINGARAICRRDRIGSLEAGKQADIIVLDVPDYRELAYYFGVNHCRIVIKRGKVVA